MTHQHAPSYDSFEAWLASRPESIQKLAAEFPPRETVIHLEEVPYIICGYKEPDLLILVPNGTPVGGEQECLVYLCAAELRDPDIFDYIEKVEPE